MYNTSFYIYDADGFTREYFDKEKTLESLELNWLMMSVALCGCELYNYEIFQTTRRYAWFETTTINWLPDNTPIQIHLRPFQKALFSLLNNPLISREENFSFPHSSNPLTPNHFPEINDDTEISELHHGSWWSDTWRKDCDCSPDSNEILVPIILYMDGISLDTHGKLNLTPLNMTLGIFNVETRTKDYAWETIYFHPCALLNNLPLPS